MTEDELWDHVESAIRDVVGIVRETSIPMHNSDIERLVQVRGVGRWTVEMLLIFKLGRPDVFPADDFGVRNGYRIAYGLDAMPSPKELLALGAR